MNEIRKIDHIAVVVESIESALPFWQEGLGLTLTRIEELPEQAARIAFLPFGDSEIELVEPLTDDSGISRFLQKRGSGLHHICFEVPDLDASLSWLKEKQVGLINEEPAAGAGGKRMAFIHPASASGVLIELYEAKKIDNGIFPEIETGRLVLREHAWTDAPEVYDIFSRMEVTDTLCTAPMTEIQEAAEKIRARQRLFTDKIGLRWAVAIREEPDRLIGSCGYSLKRKYCVELGYEIHPAYWDRGLISEAITAVIDYGFSENALFPVHRIEAVTVMENPASLAVLQKLSFKPEGIRRGLIKDGIEFVDVRSFALLKPEWVGRV